METEMRHALLDNVMHFQFLHSTPSVMGLGSSTQRHNDHDSDALRLGNLYRLCATRFMSIHASSMCMLGLFMTLMR